VLTEDDLELDLVLVERVEVLRVDFELDDEEEELAFARPELVPRRRPLLLLLDELPLVVVVRPELVPRLEELLTPLEELPRVGVMAPAGRVEPERLPFKSSLMTIPPRTPSVVTAPLPRPLEVALLLPRPPVVVVAGELPGRPLVTVPPGREEEPATEEEPFTLLPPLPPEPGPVSCTAPRSLPREALVVVPPRRSL
jgi:hypothetical protein